MPYSFYDSSIAVGLNALDSLKDILVKASASPNASSLNTARIHANMLDLTFQVTFSTDLASKLYARTSGIEPMKWEKELKTFDDFFTRIDEVKALLSKADKDLINSRADEIVPLGLGQGKTIDLPASKYVTCYALPNLFFHVTTAYDICRMNDVELGKRDYLNAFMTEFKLPQAS